LNRFFTWLSIILLLSSYYISQVNTPLARQIKIEMPKILIPTPPRPQFKLPTINIPRPPTMPPFPTPQKFFTPTTITEFIPTSTPEVIFTSIPKSTEVFTTPTPKLPSLAPTTKKKEMPTTPLPEIKETLTKEEEEGFYQTAAGKPIKLSNPIPTASPPEVTPPPATPTAVAQEEKETEHLPNGIMILLLLVAVFPFIVYLLKPKGGRSK